MVGCRAGFRDWPLGSGRRRLGRRPGRDEHHRPRGIGGTHPGRSSCVRNAVTPSRSGQQVLAGKPTVRRAQLPRRESDDREANAGGRKATGNRDAMAGPSSRSSRITGLCVSVSGRGPVTSDPAGRSSGRRRADSITGCRPAGFASRCDRYPLCRPSPPEDRRRDLIGAWHQPRQRFVRRRSASSAVNQMKGRCI